MKLNKKILLIGILFLILPNISSLIISEIMYAPTQSEYYNEWIEIYNDGSSDINLNNWTLCNDELLAGYVDYNDGGKLKLNDSRTLNAGEYAIITDGGSGTEVYGNFNVNANALVLHTDAASLCGGLINSGETIILKDQSGNLINSISYNSNLAYNNDKSLQICSASWIEETPTPGSVNKCQTQIPQNQTQNNTPTGNVSQTNNQTGWNTSTLIENETNGALSESGQKIISTGETIKEKESEIIILNTNSKDIKSSESTKKLDKNNYAKYLLSAFVFLLILLFLLKGKISRKKYKNEFKEE